MSNIQRAFVASLTMLLCTTLAACSNSAVATVNGQAISSSDFDTKLESTPQAKGLLQQMVTQKLVEQYAAKNNIAVSDDDINKKENEIKANFPGDQWTQFLSMRGMTETDVHDILKQQILMDKSVGKDINVTDAQVAEYFKKNHAAFDKPEQVRARHILVADLPTAQKIETQLKSGGDFAALAKQYSKDPGSAQQGGELGLFPKGRMTPVFEHYAFTGAVNAISPPIKSPFGYHIIQVEEKQPAQLATLASAHDKIVETLRQQQEAPLVQPFITNLQSQANIQINNPKFASLYPSPAASAAAPAAPASAAPAPTKK